MFRRARLSVKPNVRPGAGGRGPAAPEPPRGQQVPREPEPAAPPPPPPPAPQAAETPPGPQLDPGAAEPLEDEATERGHGMPAGDDAGQSSKSSTTVLQRRKRISTVPSLTKSSAPASSVPQSLCTVQQESPQPSPLPVKEKQSCSDRYRILKAQKLREMLREEMTKRRKQWKNKYAGNESQMPPDRSKMTMRDLIYYLPDSNPMKSSLEQETKTEKSTPAVQTKDQEEKNIPDGEDDVEEMEEESNDGPLLVPRVKVAEDGSIILDEESLTVEVLRTKGPCVVEENDPIFERGSTTTYSSFRKNYYSKPWSNKETDMFFLAISMVGTDFSMIGQLFPHRARIEIKNKFKREEKANGWRIDKAFQEKRPFDFDFFARLLEKVLAEEEKRKQKTVKNQNTKEKKSSRPRKKQNVNRVASGEVDHDLDDSQNARISDMEGTEMASEIVEKENDQSLNIAGQTLLESVVNRKKRKRKKKDDTDEQEAENLSKEAADPSDSSKGEKPNKKKCQLLVTVINGDECNKDLEVSHLENLDEIACILPRENDENEAEHISSASNQDDNAASVAAIESSEPEALDLSPSKAKSKELIQIVQVDSNVGGKTSDTNIKLLGAEKTDTSKHKVRGRPLRPKPNLLGPLGKKAEPTENRIEVDSKNLFPQLPGNVEKNLVEKDECSPPDITGNEVTETESQGPEAECHEKHCLQETNKASTFRPPRLTRGRLQRPKPHIGRTTGQKEVLAAEDKTGTREEEESESTVAKDGQAQTNESLRLDVGNSSSQSEKEEVISQKSQTDEPETVKENQSLQDSNKSSTFKRGPVMRTRFQKPRPNIGRATGRGEISTGEKAPKDISITGEVEAGLLQTDGAFNSLPLPDVISCGVPPSVEAFEKEAPSPKRISSPVIPLKPSCILPVEGCEDKETPSTTDVEKVSDVIKSKCSQDEKLSIVKKTPFVRSRFKRPRPNLGRAVEKSGVPGAAKCELMEKMETGKLEIMIQHDGKQDAISLPQDDAFLLQENASLNVNSSLYQDSASSTQVTVSSSQVDASSPKDDSIPFQGDSMTPQVPISPSQPDAFPPQDNASPPQINAFPLQDDISPLQDDASSPQGDASTLKGKASTLQGEAIFLQVSAPPLQGSVSTLQGKASHLQDNALPLQGSISPLQGDASTLQVKASPLQDNASPLQGTVSALQGSVSSPQGDASVLQGKSSPLQDNASPLQGSESPLQDSVSLLQGDAFTLQGKAFPLQDNASLLQDSVSPLQDNASPLQDEASPLQGYASPLQGEAFPLQGSASLLQDNASLFKGNASSLQGKAFPLQSDTSPLQGDASPLQGDASPLKAEAFPLQGDVSSLQDEVSPLPGKASSLQDEVSPLKDNASFLQGNTSPLQGDASPLKGEAFPFQGDISPLQDEVSPLPGKASPLQDEVSPLKDNASFLQSNTSPLQGDASPLKGEAFPFQGYVSPLQDEVSPLPGKASPLQDDISPLKDNASFLQGKASPLQGDASPLKGDVSPLQGDVSPLQDEVSPLPGKASPLQDDISPLKDNASFLQGKASPLQGDASPLKDDVSPFQGDVSPLQDEVSPLPGKASPLQDEVSPLKENASFLQGNTSPLQSYASLKGEAFPFQGNVYPLQDEVSPLPGKASPLRDEVSPLQDNAPFLQGNASLLQGVDSSLRDEVFPLIDNTSPLRDEASSLQGEVSSLPGKAFPLKGDVSSQDSTSPTQVGAFPAQVCASPPQLAASSLQVIGSPSQGDASVPQDDIFPPQNNAFPPQINTSSPQNNVFPPQMAAFSTQDDASPFQIDVSPLQVDVSPIQVAASSLQVSASPTQVVTFSPEDDASPVQVTASCSEIAALSIQDISHPCQNDTVESSQKTVVKYEKPVPEKGEADLLFNEQTPKKLLDSMNCELEERSSFIEAQENGFAVSTGIKNSQQEIKKNDIQPAQRMRGRFKRPRPNISRAERRGSRTAGKWVIEERDKEEGIIQHKNASESEFFTLPTSKIEHEVVPSEVYSMCGNKNQGVSEQNLQISRTEVLNEQISDDKYKPHSISPALLRRSRFQTARPNLGRVYRKKEEPGTEKIVPNKNDTKKVEDKLLEKGDSDTHQSLKDKTELLSSLGIAARKECVDSRDAALPKEYIQSEKLDSFDRQLDDAGLGGPGAISSSVGVEEQFLNKSRYMQQSKEPGCVKSTLGRRIVTSSISECETDNSDRRMQRKSKQNFTKGRGSKRVRGRISKKEPKTSKAVLVTLRASQEEDEEDIEDLESEYEEENYHLAPEEVNKAPVFVPIGLRSPEPVSAQIEETMEELEISVNVPDVPCITIAEHLLPDVNASNEGENQEQNLNASVEITTVEYPKEETGINDGSTEAAIALLTMGNQMLQSETSTEGIMCVLPEDDLRSHISTSNPENFDHRVLLEHQVLSSSVSSTLLTTLDENKNILEEQNAGKEVNIPGQIKENSTPSSDQSSKKTTSLRTRSRFPKPKPNLSKILGKDRRVLRKVTGLPATVEQQVDIQSETVCMASKGAVLEDRNLESKIMADGMVQTSRTDLHSFEGTDDGKEVKQIEREENQDKKSQESQMVSPSPLDKNSSNDIGCNLTKTSTGEFPKHDDGRHNLLVTHFAQQCTLNSGTGAEQQNIINTDNTAVNLVAGEHQGEEEEQTFILTLVEIPTDSAEQFAGLSDSSGPLLPAPILVKPMNKEERGDPSLNCPVGEDDTHLSSYGNSIQPSSEKPLTDLELPFSETLGHSLEESTSMVDSTNFSVSTLVDNCQKITSEVSSEESTNVYKNAAGKSYETQTIVPVLGSMCTIAEPQKIEKEQSEPTVQASGTESSEEVTYAQKEENVPHLAQDDTVVPDKQERSGATHQLEQRSRSSLFSRPGRRPLGFLSLICSKNNLESEEATPVNSQKRLKPLIPVSRHNFRRPALLNERKRKKQDSCPLPPTSAESHSEASTHSSSTPQVSCDQSFEEEKCRSDQKVETEEEPTKVTEYFFSDIFMEVDETEQN